jgi:hypothetical protein
VKKPRGSLGFDKKRTDLAASPAKVPQKSRNGFSYEKENSAKSLI